MAGVLWVVSGGVLEVPGLLLHHLGDKWGSLGESPPHRFPGWCRRPRKGVPILTPWCERRVPVLIYVQGSLFFDVMANSFPVDPS